MPQHQLALPTAPQGTTGPTLVSVDGKTFPLREVTIEARAEAGLALTTLTQTYANPYDEPLEVHYTLPLPADGAVLGFTMTLGTRTITSEVHPAEEAAALYERAIETGRAASLMQQHRTDTFTQSLGNLPPKTEAKIQIHLLHPLAFIPGTKEGGRWEYRFPTVAAVRYEGEPGRVEDAGALDPDRADANGIPVRATFELKAGAQVFKKDENVRLDHDIVARWRAAAAEVSVQVVEGAGLPGDDGRYALLTITPPDDPKELQARDLTILIDASGSMTGAPLEIAKEVAARLVESLDEDDRFEILAFASDVRALVEGPAPATPRRKDEAARALRRLSAGGATEMTQALLRALRPLRDEAQRQVVLVSDGYIGFETEVFTAVAKGRDAGVRVHVVGIGAAPNRALTRGVARSGGGVEVLIDLPEEAGAAAERLLRATVGPVVTDLAVTGDAVVTTAPAHGVDLLSWRPAIVAVSLRPEGGTIRLRGRRAGGATWETEVTVTLRAAAPVSEMPIGALYGREAVADVEARMAAAGRDEAAKYASEIEALGMRHRIATARTSLVAISEEPAVDPKAPRRRERLPVEMPRGVSAEGVGFGVDPRLTMTGISARMATMLRTEASPAFREQEVPYGPIRPLLRKMATKRRRERLFNVAARLLRSEGPRLLLEFECPDHGFVLPVPGQPVEVTLERGRPVTATAGDDGSTSPGPHARGLVLRLALILETGGDWPSEPVCLRWISPTGSTGRPPHELHPTRSPIDIEADDYIMTLQA